MPDIQQLQSRYLGLGAEINIIAQKRTTFEDAILHTDEPIPNLESKIAECSDQIAQLRKQRETIFKYLSITKQVPDEEAWRHPPDRSMAERNASLDAYWDMQETARSNKRVEMQNVDKPAKKTTRKKAAVKSKTVKVKKE